jgi:tetratricopeptide (TPR) repeat protein
MAFLTLLALLFTAGCSSVPDREEPPRRIAEQAAKYTEYGNSLFSQARFSQALEMYGYALDNYIRIDDIEGAARAYNAGGAVYMALERMEEAEGLFQRAYRTLVPPGRQEKESEYPGALAETLGNLAEVAYRRGRTEQALDYISRGLALVTAEDYPLETAVLLHNRGTVRKAEGDLQAAEDDLRRALEYNRAEDQLGEMATNYYMLGSLAMERGEPEAALEQLEQALALDKQIENSLGIAQDLQALADIHRSLGREQWAAEYDQRARRILSSLGMNGENQGEGAVK